MEEIAPSLTGVRALRSPIVGGLALFAAAACFSFYGLSARAAISAFVAAVLVVLAAIDLERRIIPNVIVLPAAGIVLLAQLAFFPDQALEWTLACLGCGLFFLVPALVYPAGLGMGDVKLGLLLGAALGRAVVPALFLGLVAVGLFGVALVVREGRAARKKPIPLGPFLAAGGLIALFSL